MKKVILSENSYNELKKKLVNEISYGKVSNASERSERLFYDVTEAFENFYEKLVEAVREAKFGRKYGQGEPNPYLDKIKELAEEINGILLKKKKQNTYFNDAIDSVDQNEYWDSEEGQENNIDNMDLNYLQKKFPQ